MKVTVLGSGSGIPVIGHFNESVLVEVNGAAYLFDAGEPCSATLHTNTLLKYYGLETVPTLPFVDIYSIRSIFISHFDADHVGGLPMLLQVMHLWQKRGLEFRFKPDNSLRLYLPPETVEFFRDALHLLHLSKMRYNLHLKPIREGDFYRDENVKVSAVRNSHIREGSSFSFSISHRDKRIVYTGDLGKPVEALLLLDDYTDLLIVECAHFSPEELFEALKNKIENLGRVIVTHIHPSLYGRERSILEAASRILGSEIIVAKDYLQVTL